MLKDDKFYIVIATQEFNKASHAIAFISIPYIWPVSTICELLDWNNIANK